MSLPFSRTASDGGQTAHIGHAGRQGIAILAGAYGHSANVVEQDFAARGAVCHAG
ncbi:hypothetical protein [Mucilaginibacter segetis]|uniref:Uncharacterized protein n=1 Tax=Mucilaginibacter segetis TaxID=2793071 RepID=A0A934PT72_9SPHI|nr:hypothetical protein [Mucilaginibacter segetis]MBK0378605.1 hypothetical protein [Mucilaginibacter segetis]